MIGGSNFETFFADAFGGKPPHPYQVRLATEAWPETLVIPTGFGKTAAILAAWLWKRSGGDECTPRRLIYCLPMRTLVEQTEKAAREWVDQAAVHFSWSAANRPLVHVLMGGEPRARGAPAWVLQVDRPAILIGTQDMLVSAALNRAYGASRFRWPVDFSLLHTDALWVFDEVQLTGATLPTSAQLEAWRRDAVLYPASPASPVRPARSLWMSATLDPAWLKTVDFRPKDALRPNDLQADDLASRHAIKLWGAIKRLSSEPAPSSLKGKDASAYYRRIVGLVQDRLRAGETVLVFLNTVARAQAVYTELNKAGVDGVILIHSRFRPPERDEATARALAMPPVIVTTQALEAGVDLSSAFLITELAPWSSMVQRIGRCNRYGECGEGGADVVWIDLPPGEHAPYVESDLDEARAKLRGLSDCGPEALSRVAPGQLADSPVIRKRDLLDLFDTEADLSGFDVDVAMYVRDAEDTDLRLFWRDIPATGAPEGMSAAAPTRQELCPASIKAASELVSRKGVRAWRIDRLGRGRTAWVELREKDLRPGLEVMIAAETGGYDSRLGLLPFASEPVSTEAVPTGSSAQPVLRLDDDSDTAIGTRVTLEAHSQHVRDEAERLCVALAIGEPWRTLLLQAALWHDRGKAHEAFQMMLSADWAAGDVLLAKSAQRPRPDRRKNSDADHGADLRRRFFRHELASMLAYLAGKGWSRDADLTAYLIAAHHGKVRMRLRALPDERSPDDGRLFARGVWQGDLLPAAMLGATVAAEAELDLDIMQLGEGEHGASWSARTQSLLKANGPFRLAWLEALVRIADWRASRAEEYSAEKGLPPDTPWHADMTEDAA